MKHKRNIFIGVLILLLSVGIVSVTAITARALTNNKTHKSVSNEFVMSNVSISVIENGSDATNTGKTLSWVSQKATKEISIKNNNTGNPLDVYVRVALVPKWIGQEKISGVTTDVEYSEVFGVKPFGDLQKLTTFSGNKATLGDITLVFNESWTLKDGCYQSDNWFYVNGFFYYKKALTPGESSPLLLKEVRIEEAALETISSRGIKFSLNVDADAIQTEDGSVENKWGSYGIVKEAKEIKFKTE